MFIPPSLSSQSWLRKTHSALKQARNNVAGKWALFEQNCDKASSPNTALVYKTTAVGFSQTTFLLYTAAKDNQFESSGHIIRLYGLASDLYACSQPITHVWKMPISEKP